MHDDVLKQLLAMTQFVHFPYLVRSVWAQPGGA
jgi:hypothetical protein